MKFEWPVDCIFKNVNNAEYHKNADSEPLVELYISEKLEDFASSMAVADCLRLTFKE